MAAPKAIEPRARLRSGPFDGAATSSPTAITTARIRKAQKPALPFVVSRSEVRMTSLPLGGDDAAKLGPQVENVSRRNFLG